MAADKSNTGKLIREFYKSKELDPTKAQAILKASAPARSSNRFRLLGMAATLLIIASAGFFYVQQKQNAITQRVMEEIALNHRKNLRPDIQTGDFNSVKKHLAKIEFTLARPEMLESGYRLAGGRYCSIQGKLAAQLLLRDARNERITLYITPVTESTSHIKNETVSQEEIEIKIWQERGLLYGLARRRP